MKLGRQGLVIACVALGGCGAEPSERPAAFTVSDSSGVTIREYGAPASWTAPLTLTERTRIGTLDGPPPTLFTTIAGGRILDDGTLVLADLASHEVRLFTPEGDFIRSHGGEGQGPGEYQYIVGVGQCAPSGFTVFDIGWTMSFYDAAGEFVEERVTRLEGGATPYELACDTSGRVAVLNWDLSSQGPRLGFHTAMARLRIMDSDGAESLNLGERIGSERFGRPTGSGPHPAGRSTRFGFAGGDLIVSDGSFFGFERWDRAGKLVEIVRVGGIQPPDLDSLMAAYLDWTLARARNDDQRALWRQQVAEMEGPARASFLSDLLVSGEHVLVREPTLGNSGRWFAFDLDGTPRGYLPLPAGAQLLDMRNGRLLVAERGELDVMGAALYAVGGRE